MVIYYADGNTIAALFDPRTEQPISNVLKTDTSGFVTFNVLTLTTLTFRLLTGLTLSPAAYFLYEGVEEGWAHKVNTYTPQMCYEWPQDRVDCLVF